MVVAVVLGAAVAEVALVGEDVVMAVVESVLVLVAVAVVVVVAVLKVEVVTVDRELAVVLSRMRRRAGSRPCCTLQGDWLKNKKAFFAALFAVNPVAEDAEDNQQVLPVGLVAA